MTAPAQVPVPVVPAARTWLVLARFEARRLVRSPVFLAGAAICGVATVSSTSNRTADILAGDGFFPALFVGVVSMVVAHRLTGSMRRSEEVLVAAPTPVTARTASLCAACLIPAAAGLLWLAYVLFALHRWAPQPWTFGTFGATDRVAILGGESVLACLGAPLLGVAAARWLRFRGAAVLLVAAVVGWVAVASAVAIGTTGGLPATALRLSAPFAFFLTSGRGYRTLDSWTGSPVWYAVELVALCALAAVGALLSGAEELPRRRLLGVGAACLAAVLLAYALAVTGGLSHVVTTSRDGTRTTAAAR